MLSGKDVNDLIDVDTIIDVHHCQTQRMQRRTFMLGIYSLRRWRDKRGSAVLAAEPPEECVQFKSI